MELCYKSSTVLTKAKHKRTRYGLAKRGGVSELHETFQPALLPAATDEALTSPQNGVTKLNGGFADSAFADNKQRPIHRWVPWIAGFSSEFVRDAFSRYLPGKPTQRTVVLDPFCGVGTTLIEALRCGYDTVGFEINPYAALGRRVHFVVSSVHGE